MYREPHPLKNKTVRLCLKSHPHPMGPQESEPFIIEDWWINIAGKSWKLCNGNPGCLIYAMRAGYARMPSDDEVVYGHSKTTRLGHLIHVSEIRRGDDKEA